MPIQREVVRALLPGGHFFTLGMECSESDGFPLSRATRSSPLGIPGRHHENRIRAAIDPQHDPPVDRRDGQPGLQGDTVQNFEENRPERLGHDFEAGRLQWEMFRQILDVKPSPAATVQGGELRLDSLGRVEAIEEAAGVLGVRRKFLTFVSSTPIPSFPFRLSTADQSVARSGSRLLHFSVRAVPQSKPGARSSASRSPRPAMLFSNHLAALPVFPLLPPQNACIHSG